MDDDRTMESQMQDRSEPSDTDAAPEANASPMSRSPGPGAGGATEGQPSLLADDRGSVFRSRWEEIQARFVDEPRTAVEEADRLVTEVVDQLQASFTSERGRLEGQWQRGDDVSTEDLRLALQRYRSFFDRLLAA